MHLKLTQENLRNSNSLIIREVQQKDYEHFNGNDVEIFIYGYPYSEATATWVTASDLYQMYKLNGVNFVNDIEGCYAIITLDKTNERGFIVTDRYGIYNFFYSRQPDTIIISDNIIEIVSDIPDISLDQISIIEFLNLGLVLGTKTLIQEIHKFRPATIHTLESDLTLSETPYWEYFWENDRKISSEEFRCLFNDHIATGLKLEERISLPLTGGLDTRTTLSACLSAKEHLHCYTHGVQSSADIKIATKISQRLNISHDVYLLDDEWIKSIPLAAERNVEIFNDVIDLIWYSHLENSYIKEEGKGELFFSGLGGEMLRSSLASRQLFNATSLDDISAALRRAIQLGKVVDVYKDFDSQQVVKLLNESVNQELAKTKAKDAITMAEYFYLSSRIANFMSYSLRLVGKHLRVFNPFLSRKLLQAIQRLDVQGKVSGATQRYIISANSPVLEKFLLGSGECLNPKDLQMRLKSYMALTTRYFRAGTNLIARRLFKKEIFTRPYFVDYASWLRKYHSQLVQDILDYDQMILSSLFDRQRLAAAVRLFLSGRNDLVLLITHLMSLEIWLRKIGERANIEKPF